MAIVEKRVCDIYGTQLKVVGVKVTVQIGASDVVEYEADMSPQAQKRLDRWVKRAFAAPSKAVADGK